MELSALTHLVDQFTAAREARLTADRTAKELKKEEDMLAERIIALAHANETKFIGGTFFKVTVQTVTKPIVANWAMMYDYMMANDAMDLVQKRINEGAVKLRLEDGLDMPFIDHIVKNKLSVSKI
jgi:hypothetical protein